MTPFANDAESDIASELIDLDGISFRELRNLDHPLFNQSIRFASDQANRPSKTETSCSSLSAF